MEFVERNVEAEAAWVIELDSHVVGSIFLGEELACLLDPAFHRRGISTEAAVAVIKDAFGRRDYTQIAARAAPANLASVRALASLGFIAADDGIYRLDRTTWAGRTG